MNKFQTQMREFLFNGKPVRPAILCLAGIFAVFAIIAGLGGGSAVNVSAQISSKTLKGDWSAEFDAKKPAQIYFTLQRRNGNDGYNMTSDDLPLTELQGLTTDALSSARTNVSFNIVREAGTFACEGYFSSGRGTGFWTLAPNEKFIAAMKSRGYANLTDEDLLRAAFNDLTIKFIDDLKTAGYNGLTFDEVVRAHNHDVDAEFVKEVKAMGFERQPMDSLIRMRNHEINAEFVNEMKSAGFENLSIDDLIRLKNHDITAQFISDLKAEGYADVSADIAIRLKNHDVDRDFIRRAKAQGYTNASLEELIRLSNRGLVK
jgi:uncharacterized protein (UPF0335 family)